MVTAVSRRHEATLAEIKAAARRVMAAEGSAAIGLRAVAREMGMTPSALYRYVDSREALITALIVDSFDAVGEAVEAAARGLRGKGGVEGCLVVAKAFRRWCLDHPSDFALLYGSPIPDFEVQHEATNPAAMRVPLAMLGVVAEELARPVRPEADAALTPTLRKAMTQLARDKPEMFAGFPPAVIAGGLASWTALLGAVAGELFGHCPPEIRGRSAEALFEFSVRRQLSLLGI